MSRIVGGYILQPRAIDESDVFKFPPHVREIWLYLLRKANHSDMVLSGTIIKRGQLFTSYKDIIDDLSWYVGYRKESYKKHHCETAMKLLTREGMIATAKTTRGMIITICKYDYYQNPSNYETDSESDKRTTRDIQSTDTINKNVKNKKNDNNIYTPIIFEEKERLVFSSLILVMNEILEDQSCIEDFQISAGSPYPTSDEIKNKIKEFFIKLTVDGERTKDRKSAIYHFKSWISREIEQKEIKQDQLNLGVGEFIKDGKRYYGKQRPVEVPMNMPPRPSDRHYFNLSLKQWNV